MGGAALGVSGNTNEATNLGFDNHRGAQPLGTTALPSIPKGAQRPGSKNSLRLRCRDKMRPPNPTRFPRLSAGSGVEAEWAQVFKYFV